MLVLLFSRVRGAKEVNVKYYMHMLCYMNFLRVFFVVFYSFAICFCFVVLCFVIFSFFFLFFFVFVSAFSSHRVVQGRTKRNADGHKRGHEESSTF